MNFKPAKDSKHQEVVYTKAHWTLLRKNRENAIRIMSALEKVNIRTIIHGSIARGDITKKSDIDLFVTTPSSSFRIETALEKENLSAKRRMIIQATPRYAMKAHIEISDNTSISFSLMRMRKIEREFYKFGGEADVDQLRRDIRVVGVDKRLILIQPSIVGHTEMPIIGQEEFAAKILGISVETVQDRVHALLKRDKIGRTGVFIKRVLSENETFEMLLQRLTYENPAVRRRTRQRI